jgi:hypothetical protein
MVLSGEELAILHGMMNSTSSIATYSYEVAVRGTVVNGAAQLVCSGIALIIMNVKVIPRIYLSRYFLEYLQLLYCLQ